MSKKRHWRSDKAGKYVHGDTLGSMTIHMNKVTKLQTEINKLQIELNKQIQILDEIVKEANIVK